MLKTRPQNVLLSCAWLWLHPAWLRLAVADIEWVSGVQWGYCVLDEGHTIRNPSSKITQVRRTALCPGSALSSKQTAD